VKRKKHCEWQNKLSSFPNNSIQRTAYYDAAADLNVMPKELRMNRRIRVFLSLLILVFFCQPLGFSAVDDHVSNKPGAFIVSKNKGHMNTSSSIRDVVNHPSFKGFGQFILPLDNRA
jgi:hypothetical protein